MFWLKGNVKDSNEKGTLGKVHEELYDKLRSEFSYLPRSLRIVIGTLSQTRVGSTTLRRFPSVHKPTVWLMPRLSCYLNLETTKVKIASVGELQILGYPRNIKDYLSWKMREARLIVKGGKAFLKVVFEKGEQKVEPKSSVAVDINMAEVVVGKD